jgi:signal transduction histidine kinase
MRSSSLHRLRLEPQRLDLVVAVVLTIAAVAQSLAGGAANGLRLEPALLAPAMTLPVAVRRRWPASVAIWVTLVASLELAVWGDAQLVGTTIAYLCALYGAAVWADTRAFVGVLLAGVVIGLPIVSIGQHDLSGTAFFSAIVFVAMLIVRRVVRGREERARLAERERDVVVREAVVEERARIARELHDAVAHNVSMVVMQAGAERRVLEKGEGSPHEVLGTIEQAGRGALAEMRRLVGMLRTDATEPLSPQPRLREVGDLVEEARRAGMEVEFQVEGEARELPVGLELAAYRIVEEALGAASRRGGGDHARVIVRYDTHMLELEVIGHPGEPEPAPEPGGGALLGIRERVALYGGRLDAGRRVDGGFGIRVLLPVP